jgi:hypothetical protein
MQHLYIAAACCFLQSLRIIVVSAGLVVERQFQNLRAFLLYSTCSWGLWRLLRFVANGYLAQERDEKAFSLRLSAEWPILSVACLT